MHDARLRDSAWWTGVWVGPNGQEKTLLRDPVAGRWFWRGGPGREWTHASGVLLRIYVEGLEEAGFEPLRDASTARVRALLMQETLD